jgi:exportin-5
VAISAFAVLRLTPIQDPMIRKRTLQLLVYFSTTALKQNTNFMLNVLEHILMTWPTVEPEYRAYNDAIKDLQSESMVELQRLASEVPDDLLVSFRSVMLIPYLTPPERI